MNTFCKEWLAVLSWKAWTPLRHKLPFFALTFLLGTAAALGFEPLVLATSIGAVYAGAAVRHFTE